MLPDGLQIVTEVARGRFEEGEEFLPQLARFRAQRGEEERLLASQMVVHGRLGDARARSDGVDAGSLVAQRHEYRQGSLEDLLPLGGGKLGPGLFVDHAPLRARDRGAVARLNGSVLTAYPSFSTYASEPHAW